MKQCAECKELLPFNKFYVNKQLRDGHFKYCIKCTRIQQNKYSNTENGYMTNLFKSIKNRENASFKKGHSEIERKKRHCHVTKKEFFELWENHKLKYGYTCALTGINIGFTVDNSRDFSRSTGISVDRLNPEIAYVKENIIFVAGRVNSLKNAVTKELCIAILKAYEERGW